MSLNYDNEIPNKSNFDDHGVKKADRKYKPNFPKDMPRLPSIEEFKLDRIICDDLKEESQEVVDSMIKVATSYQNDLKSEIRRKLSIEQKIQFKNIEIAKIAHSLSKNIAVRNKKLRKAISNNGSNSNSMHNNSASLLLLGTESTIDDEIEILLELSAKASGKIRGLTQRLSKIDHKVNRMKTDEILGQPNSRRKQEYPYIHKMLSQKGRKSEIKPASPVNKVSDEALTERDPMSEPNVNRKNLPLLQDIKDKPVIQQTPPIVEEEDMDAEQFELFMSSSINKYRDLQLNKYNDVDIFTKQEFNKNSELNDIFFDENEINDSTSGQSTSLSTFKPGNPLSLLYSSIIEDPISNDRRLSVRPSLSNMAINVKSPATVKSTLQTSHFKKLRINGSPITSETFQKMKEKPTCECNNHEDDDHLSHFSDHSEDSMAKRALTDSLVALESFHMSSDDTSGLNTDPEDNDIESEPNMTSESSDLDSMSSESSDNKTNTYADQYYTLLKADLKKKKKKKRLHLERTQQIHKRRIYQRKDISPTPKHKPSHHSLKPKRSILKLPPMKIQPNSNVPPFPKIRITGIVSDSSKKHNTLMPEIKNIAASTINTQPTVGASSINDFTVTGTMVLARPNSNESSSNENDENEVILWNGLPQEVHDDNADSMSLKSISRLKGLL